DGVPPVTSKNPLLVTVSPLPGGGVDAIYDNGSVLAIGNTSMTCSETIFQLTCPGAQRGEGLDFVLNRQNYDMRFVRSQTTPDSEKVGAFNPVGNPPRRGTSHGKQALSHVGGRGEGRQQRSGTVTRRPGSLSLDDATRGLHRSHRHDRVRLRRWPLHG